MSPATTQDLSVEGHAGRLFVRSWSPETLRSDIPIVIFHDSLGCVELWRGFPAALSSATGRRVIGYDRLGFGRSDVHPGKLPRDFIADEAETGFATLRRQLDLALAAVDLGVQFGQSPHRVEERPRPRLDVREHGRPVDPLQDDPASAGDLD